MYLKQNVHPGMHPGIHYLELLAMISTQVRPNLYFEIGTNAGDSLRQFECDTVCVDPNFVIQGNVLGQKRSAAFFQTTSDDFFRRNDASIVLSSGIDVSFLDGLHRFEYLLRDFINTEKHGSARATILLHDCLPPNAEMTDRFFEPGRDWAGDVWKLVFIIKRYRPDIRVKFFDCPPTGLVACINLDRDNDVLARNYQAILDEYGPLELTPELHSQLWGLFPTVDTRLLAQRPYDLTTLI